jgi:ribonuclease BN (tRNA processing enzyme)
VFITHLHIDHFGSLPYLYMFGGWAGRWHKPLRVFGPSGRTPEYGTATMVEGMQKMLGWHMDAFSVFPVGEGHDIESTSSISGTTAGLSTTRVGLRSSTGSDRTQRTAHRAIGSTGMA